MRHYKRTLSVSLVVGALALSTACEDRTTAFRAVPGTLTLVLETPPGQHPGGVTLTVGGPELSAPISVDREFQMFVVDVTPSSATVAVVGTAVRGPIARIDVPDITDLTGYSVNIVEMVDENNELMRTRDGYRVVFEADATPARSGSRFTAPAN